MSTNHQFLTLLKWMNSITSRRISTNNILPSGKVNTDSKSSRKITEESKNGKRPKLFQLESINSVIWHGLNSAILISWKVFQTKSTEILSKLKILILIGEKKTLSLELKTKVNADLVGPFQQLVQWNHSWLNLVGKL